MNENIAQNNEPVKTESTVNKAFAKHYIRKACLAGKGAQVDDFLVLSVRTTKKLWTARIELDGRRYSLNEKAVGQGFQHWAGEVA
ncbi:MAG: hypothetical protein AAF702_44655 [Chloroflexota bacterium]